MKVEEVHLVAKNILMTKSVTIQDHIMQLCLSNMRGDISVHSVFF